MERDRRTTSAAAVVVALALAGLPLACSSTGEDDTTAAETEATSPSQQPQEDEQPLAGDEARGRDLFVENCGSCHTLDAAGTQGQIGPNLDEAQVNEADVLRAIEIGGTGSGNMPPDLVTGKDAQDVAAFVAASGPGP